MEELKATLEKAWEDGFFYNLRNGIYNEQEYLKLKKIFDQFSIQSEEEMIDRRFVTLVWLIPIFLKWNEHRLETAGVAPEKIDEIFNYFYNKCEEILQLP